MKDWGVRTVNGIEGVPSFQVLELIPKRNPYALVIPVLNENGRLTRQLKNIAAADPNVDIVIADGGSKDGSTDEQVMREFGVSALLTKTGPGKLSAQLRMAISFCNDLEYEGIITMDGNGKDGIDGIEKILQALQNGFDYVQGSRFVTGGVATNTPRERLLAIKLLHAPITSIAARHRFTDTTNGFRGLSKHLLQSENVDPLREVFDTYELLAYLPIQAARLGFKVTEVPVTRAYPQGEPTPTKIHGVRSHLHIIRILMAAAFGAYRPTIKRK